MKSKIRRGSRVKVISGADKGKEGVVLDMLCKLDKKDGNKRILVAGINIRSKHLKPRGNEAGQIIKKECPIHISNVKFIE